MRNRRGQVVLVQPKAKIDGLIMPRPQRIPKPPQIYLLVGRPLLRWLLQPMKPQRAWADFRLTVRWFEATKRIQRASAPLGQQIRSAEPKDLSQTDRLKRR